MILRLTLTTAELVGESPSEWQTLEKVVRSGQWTSGPRTAEGRLRQLAAELQVPLRVEGIAVLRTRPRVRTGERGGASERGIRPDRDVC